MHITHETKEFPQFLLQIFEIRIFPWRPITSYSLFSENETKTIAFTVGHNRSFLMIAFTFEWEPKMHCLESGEKRKSVELYDFIQFEQKKKKFFQKSFQL